MFTQKKIFLKLVLLFFAAIPFTGLINPVASAASGPPLQGYVFVYSNVPGPSSKPGPGFNSLAPKGTLVILGCAGGSASQCTPYGVAIPKVWTFKGMDGPSAQFAGDTADDGNTQIVINVSNICSNPTSGNIPGAGNYTSQNISVSGYSSAAATAANESGGKSGYSPSCSTTQGSQTITATANITGIPTTYSGQTIGPVNFIITPSGQSPTTITSQTSQVSSGTLNTGPGTPTLGTSSDTASLTASTPGPLPPGNYTVCAASLVNNPCQTVSASDFTSPINLTFTGAANSATLAGIQKTGASPTTNTCANSDFSLSWAVCPIVDVLQRVTNAATHAINNQLNIPVNNYFSNACTTAGNDTATADGCNTSVTNYKIWTSIRNLSLSLLVIVTLVMVIATAMDVGPFDAYTVKKVLPRIVIAVFAITFSWQLGRFLVQLSDDVGFGVSQLIYGAVGLTSAQVATGLANGFLSWVGASDLVLLGAGAVAAGILSVALIGPLALLLLLLPVLLGLAIAFFTLILRRLIIVVCVVFAPLALIAFILPGTQRIWKLWRESFTGALVIFPMVTGLIAMGAVLAYMTDNGNAGSSFVAPFTSLVLFVAPFFLIPRLFRMSMGALGAISGVMSNVSKAGFAGLKKQRQGTYAERRQRAKTGKLYSERNAFTRSMRSIGLGAGAGARGNWGVGKKGLAARGVQSMIGAAESEKDPKMNQIQFDDDGILALHVSAGDERIARDELSKVFLNRDGSVNTKRVETAISTARFAGFNQANAMAAGNMLMRNKARSLEAIPQSVELLDRTAKRLSGGNEQLEGNIKGSVQYWARQSGASYFGGKNGADGWKRTTMGQLSQDTTTQIKGHIADMYQAILNGTDEEKATAAIQLSEARALLPNTSASNQAIINGTFEALNISPDLKDAEGRPITIDEQLARLANAGKAPDSVISAANIGASARKYDSGVPYGARGDGSPPAGAAPTGGEPI